MEKKHAALAGISVLGLAILGYAVMSDRSEAPRRAEAPLPSSAPPQAAPLASTAPAASGIPARSPEQILEASCAGDKSKDCACRKAAVLGGHGSSALQVPVLLQPLLNDPPDHLRAANTIGFAFRHSGDRGPS